VRPANRVRLPEGRLEGKLTWQQVKGKLRQVTKLGGRNDQGVEGEGGKKRRLRHKRRGVCSKIQNPQGCLTQEGSGETKGEERRAAAGGRNQGRSEEKSEMPEGNMFGGGDEKMMTLNKNDPGAKPRRPSSCNSQELGGGWKLAAHCGTMIFGGAHSMNQSAAAFAFAFINFTRTLFIKR
jgi:hypothetical protein